MGWSRFTAYSLKLQTATRRLLIGSAIFLKIHTRKKTLSVFGSWTNVLKTRHQDKQTAKTARKKNYLQNKYQPGADQLAIYEVWSHAVEPGMIEGKSMEQLGKGHDPRTKTLSSQTSSHILLYLSLMHYAFFCITTPFFLPICCKR